MNVDRQSQSDSAVSSGRSFLRSSIVWKLTLFVGILVALNDGVLIGVAYITTSAILRDQIHERLSTVAADRQGMLASTLEQEEERVTQFAKRSRIHNLLAQRVNGTMTLERFREETEPILSTARANTNGSLAIWIEDNAGQVLAASGPENTPQSLNALALTGGRAGDHGGHFAIVLWFPWPPTSAWSFMEARCRGFRGPWAPGGMIRRERRTFARFVSPRWSSGEHPRRAECRHQARWLG